MSSNMSAAAPDRSRRHLLAVGVLCGLCLAGWLPQGGHAFQYDIWFKYPHPYTQTEPVTYCPESVSASVGRQCQSALPVYVNTLDSPKTLIPYTMNQLLDLCGLHDAREYDHSQHTEWDDNIRLTEFDVKFGRNEECRTLCKRTYKMTSHPDLYRLEELKLGLTRDYYHHWFADTLPFSWCYRQTSSGRARECFIGFPIGYTTDERGLPEDERVPVANFTKPQSMFLFNHFELTFLYESGEGKSWAGKAGAQAARISGLRVQPRSINHEAAPAQVDSPSGAATNGQQSAPSANRCSYSLPPLEVPSQYQYGLNLSLSLTWSYSVRFVEDEPGAGWADRWSRLEASLPGTGRGRWIIAFAVLALVASCSAAAYALARTLLSERRLLFVNPPDELDEPSWRLLAGDIFREPPQVALLSALVGAGCQFIASVLLSELFSAFIAYFSTSLLVGVVLLFVLLHGFVGGWVAVRLYRTFGGEQWRALCCLVSLLNPLVVFCLLVVARNLLLLYNGSLMALNVGLFGSLFMVGLCFALSLPSALAGGNLAFKMAAIEFPVRPAASERAPPPQQVSWRQPALTTLATGLVPLLCFWAVEAYPFYDSGGYLITVITIVIVLALSVAHCYFHLAHLDHRWWWRSYLACGCAALYYFLHCCYYIAANLYLDTPTNLLLYLTFALLICVALFLLTGTLGFLITFGFLWHAYARTNASPNMNYAMFQKTSQLE